MTASIKLRKQDRDTRVVEIRGHRFEVITCRNTRGNITGWGIFERWPEPREGWYGEWHIDPGQALLGECRDWLEAFARQWREEGDHG